MSEDKKIKITISPIGMPKIEAVGYAGVGCTEATSNIEKALGNGNIQRELKGEFHQQAEEQEQEKLSW